MTFTEEEFQALDMMFCVPTKTGLEDLIPNGKNTRVTLATKDQYVALARKKVGITQSGQRFDLKIALPSKSPGNQASGQTAGLFSPTHFQHNLFSPFVAEGTVGDSKTATLPHALATPGTVNYVPEKVPLQTPTPGNVEEYPHMLEEVARINTSTGMQFTDEEFKGLDIMFCVPTANGAEDLCTNGRNVQVTLATKDQYVSLARKKLAALGAQRIASSNQLRFDLKAAPANGADVAGLFSPTHFKNNIFSPYVSESSVPQPLVPVIPPGIAPTSKLALAPHQKMFLEMIAGLPSLSDAELEELQIPFSVPTSVPEQFVDLKSQSASTVVNAANINEFMRLAREKLLGPQHEERSSPKKVSLSLNSSHVSPSYPSRKITALNTNFYTMLERIRTVNVPGSGNHFTSDEFKDLQLRFTIPDGDGKTFIDLIPNGRSTHVTLENRAEFVRLADEVKAEFLSRTQISRCDPALRQFLDTHCLLSLLPQLEEQGVETLSDLKTLTDDDFTFISKAVPRRKLLIAVRSAP
jgi:hypothetical protein